MFALSKIMGFLNDPMTVFYLAVLGGCLLCLRRRWRCWGRGLLATALAVSTILALFPLEIWGAEWLENRFPRPAMPPGHVDGIIILGGGLNPAITAARGVVSVNGAVTRMTALVPLAARYPQARIVFTGGSGDLLNQSDKESAYINDFYREIGFDGRRIELEGRSRNTRENARFTREMVQPRPGEVWLLVTSAAHMPRAVGCFRAAGWPVLAWPVDYRTRGDGGPGWRDLRFNLGAGLSGLSAVLHEIMGLAAYRLLGWTDALFPHP